MLSSTCFTYFVLRWSYRSGVDTLNENYAQYYKHAITTDFEGDVVKWSIVQVLLVVRYV